LLSKFIIKTISYKIGEGFLVVTQAILMSIPGRYTGYINVAPLGLSWGVAPGYINIAPLGLIINH